MQECRKYWIYAFHVSWNKFLFKFHFLTPVRKNMNLCRNSQFTNHGPRNMSVFQALFTWKKLYINYKFLVYLSALFQDIQHILWCAKLFNINTELNGTFEMSFDFPIFICLPSSNILKVLFDDFLNFSNLLTIALYIF
jgi:hypothetical protein